MRRFIKSVLIGLTTLCSVMAITGTTNVDAYEKQKDYSYNGTADSTIIKDTYNRGVKYIKDETGSTISIIHYYCLGENLNVTYNNTTRKPNIATNEEYLKLVERPENDAIHYYGVKKGSYTYYDNLIKYPVTVVVQDCYETDSEVIKAPTLTEEGMYKYYCKSCQQTGYGTLPKLTWDGDMLVSDKWIRTGNTYEQLALDENGKPALDENGKMFCLYEGVWDDHIDSVGFYWLEKYYAHNQWIETNKGWMYFNEDGKMLKNDWLEYNGTWYYFGNDGIMATGWVFDGANWYYMSGSGDMQTGWVWDGSDWYFMDKSGAMVTGWVDDNGTWYYMNSSGAMASNEWVLYNGDWYYMHYSGAMAVDEWIDEYYINEDGIWEE